MQDIWTLKYRPSSLDDFLGNRLSVSTLKSLASSGSLPHMIFHGPENAGKTTAALLLGDFLYGDDRDINFTYLNASDFFEQGKSYLSRDKRFFRLLGTEDPARIQKSIIAVFKDVLNEYAALAPIGAPFKIIYIADADALTDDAQHSLRRIMEKYSGTCRFVFSVRHASGLIAPLRSRCITLFFSRVHESDLFPFLKKIACEENLSISDDDLETLVRTSGGSVADAVDMLQLSALSAPPDPSGRILITADHIDAQRRNVDPDISAFMSAALVDKDFKKARHALDKLLFDVGMTGREILEQAGIWVEKTVFSEERAAEMRIVIARGDERLTGASNERIVLEMFAAEMAGL